MVVVDIILSVKKSFLHIEKDFSLSLASINPLGQYMFHVLVFHPIIYSRLVFYAKTSQVIVEHIFYQLQVL